MNYLEIPMKSKWLRSLGASAVAFFLLTGSAYAVTVINADLSTNGTVSVGTGAGDQGVMTYDGGTATFILNNAQDDIDFQVKTPTDDRAIYLDAGTGALDLVGGSGSTGCTIDGSGNLTCTGDITGGP